MQFLVGVDASRTTVARRTGTENYALNLIRALLARRSEYRYRLYFRNRPATGLFPASDAVEQRVIPFPRLWTHVRLSWEMIRQPPDLLFVPAHVLPPIRPCRSLVTVHDLGYRRFPQAHRPLDRLYLDLSTRWNARAATCVLADSEATKADLIREYATPADKIAVVYPGRDESLRRVQDPALIAAVKEKYGVTGDYVLYVGTLHPRKNLIRLIEAFSTLSSQLAIGNSQFATLNLQLVIAGRKGWLYDEIFTGVRDLSLDGRVVFTGYVADADLPALLSGARLFAFPSLYEGFGFPVLEAMSCGVPVVCSNCSSLSEVAGDAALLVNPLDTAAMATAMTRLLADESLRADLVARGYEQARRFSWERAARQVLGIIEGLIG
ncbi:MAG: glycosyltransferase family 4 protein [Anaerolineae bacterium]|nr:MAG: glycosyltransferase family 4 protein [Anaerolineae bacterium]